MLTLLPQELIEASIDATSHLDDVRARALVDPCSTSQSQRKLFRHVELDRPSRCIAFRTVVRARPRVASYVHSLSIGAAAAPEIAATLAALPEVRTLSADELIVDNGHPRLASGELPHSTIVGELTLRRPTFTSPSAIHHLISGFPNLRSLSLLQATVHPSLSTSGKITKVPFDVFALLRLRDLRIDAPHVPGGTAAAVGDTIGQSIASLDVLHFRLERQSSVGMLHALLEHVGPGLSGLELDVASCRTDADILLSGVDISLASNLTSLSITASLYPSLSADRVHGDTWEDFITPFFEQATLPSRLRTITLRLQVRVTNWQIIGALSWERLDMALSSSRFKDLERVKAILQTHAPVVEAQKRVRDVVFARAASLHARDVLRVEFQHVQ